MANVVREGVLSIGIADNLPKTPKYFTEISIPCDIQLPSDKPDMEQLLSIMVDAEVISTKLIDTPIALSNEGQKLSGCKLIVELRLKEQIKYVEDEPTQSVHIVQLENLLKSVFIVVPCDINGVQTRELVARNKVFVKTYIEDIYGEMIDARTIFKNITIFVDARFPGQCKD